MKKISTLPAVLMLLLSMAAALPAFAAEKNEVTITGNCVCAKCALHESDKCENVIQTKESSGTVTYHLAQNKASKNFHENVCKQAMKVTATGTITEESGKKVLTASKIRLVK